MRRPKQKQVHKSYPLSLHPADYFRIARMAEKEQRSFSDLVRRLVLPQVEIWERVNVVVDGGNEEQSS